jgi:hypothetical protein
MVFTNLQDGKKSNVQDLTAQKWRGRLQGRSQGVPKRVSATAKCLSRILNDKKQLISTTTEIMEKQNKFKQPQQ